MSVERKYKTRGLDPQSTKKKLLQNRNDNLAKTKKFVLDAQDVEDCAGNPGGYNRPNYQNG